MKHSKQKTEQTPYSVSKQAEARQNTCEWAGNIFYPWNPLPKKNEFKLLKWHERKQGSKVM